MTMRRLSTRLSDEMFAALHDVVHLDSLIARLGAYKRAGLRLNAVSDGVALLCDRAAGASEARRRGVGIRHSDAAERALIGALTAADRSRINKVSDRRRAPSDCVRRNACAAKPSQGVSSLENCRA